MTPQEAIVWAESLCSRAEYSTGEVRQRLLRKALTPSDADAVVRHLVERRFVDNARFARVFVHEKVGYQRWGRRKVVMALTQKGVGRDDIDEALAEIDKDQYVEGLAALLRAKFRKIVEAGDIPYAERAKIYRFAMARGYESAAIAAALPLLKN